MKYITYISLITSLLLIGCVTAGKTSKLQIGMSKDEVYAAMGKPVSIASDGDVTYLTYRLSETSDDAFMGLTSEYFVRLKDGVVNAYGKKGDFDSTKVPTSKIITESNIKVDQDSDIKVDSSGDLYTELKKLKDLLDEEIITEEEFEAKKKEILQKN